MTSAQKSNAPSSQNFFSRLWHEIEPRNPLKKSFFISGSALTLFRYFTLLINTITFIWTLYITPNEFTPTYWTLCAFLTIWGFMICFLYSIFVIIWSDVPDNSPKWKAVYILGEIGFALELMICPFFFTVIFPNMLMTMNLSNWDITYHILIHFVVPVLIWLETLFNDLSFPKGHKVVLHIVIVAYLINNLAWTIHLKRPVYLPVNWVTAESYILKVMASLTVVGGFAVGGLVHRWKKSKYQNNIKATKQQ